MQVFTVAVYGTNHAEQVNNKPTNDTQVIKFSTKNFEPYLSFYI